MSETNNKEIAKNTLFLYIRMLFTMAVSLYTSRVILHVLGVDDFGIYQAVGGIVILLSFVNSALSTGSSRFLTYELGTRDCSKLARTFSSILSVHIILAAIIVIFAETIGLWFVYNKLVIAPERLEAAVFAYHLSILSAVIAITQVPYRASIISHEKMSIFAYFSIIEVSLKLGIVYILHYSSLDKLKLYACLLCFVNIGIAMFYRIYCIMHFSETKYKFIWDKNIIQDILGFSSWNLIANGSIALNNQGSTILINMFFNPSVVTARAVANQVNMAANQFINNFRTAANPQIIKRFAAGDLNGSKRLLLTSTLFSFYMMLMLGLPIIVTAEPLLKFWLGIVPEYSVEFLQLSILTSLCHVFGSSFYTALNAKGRLRENSLSGPTVSFIVFPIIYLCFKLGSSPIAVAWGLLFIEAFLGFVQKPILLIKIVGYKWSDIFSVFIPCAKVGCASAIIPVILHNFLQQYSYASFFINILICIICVLSTASCIWILGLDKAMRFKIGQVIQKKLS